MGLFKKIGKGLKKDLKKIGKGIKSVEQFVVLEPFKNMMKKQLDARKIAHTSKLSDIASKFFKEIVKGKNHFEMQNLGEDIAVGIVQEIIDWIKGVKKKKDSGQKLSPAEEAVLNDANTVATQTKGFIKGQTENKVGSFVTDNWVLIAAVVLLLLLFVFKKK